MKIHMRCLWRNAPDGEFLSKRRGGGMTSDYEYVIVGSGLAGASAIEGMRERDAQARYLVISTYRIFSQSR